MSSGTQSSPEALDRSTDSDNVTAVFLNEGRTNNTTSEKIEQKTDLFSFYFDSICILLLRDNNGVSPANSSEAAESANNESSCNSHGVGFDHVSVLHI